mmetsp:Transcript_21404/g.26471  ORF Transcript_21404/g.26471 Transcript_21404/m.26471 type:complete len:99 (-) Transcript_21404:8-304(-)
MQQRLLVQRQRHRQNIDLFQRLPASRHYAPSRALLPSSNVNFAIRHHIAPSISLQRHATFSSTNNVIIMKISTQQQPHPMLTPSQSLSHQQAKTQTQP